MLSLIIIKKFLVTMENYGIPKNIVLYAVPILLVMDGQEIHKVLHIFLQYFLKFTKKEMLIWTNKIPDILVF